MTTTSNNIPDVPVGEETYSLSEAVARTGFKSATSDIPAVSDAKLSNASRGLANDGAIIGTEVPALDLK